MTNQTKIIESNGISKLIISAYEHDNKVIQDFILAKTRYFGLINPERIKTAKIQYIDLTIGSLYLLVVALIGIYFISDNRVFYSQIAVLIFTLILGLSFHPRFRRKDVTRDLIQNLSTLEMVSETTRSYVTKLLEQLPSDTDPYLILKTIYDRDIAIYDDAKEVQHDQSQ